MITEEEEKELIFLRELQADHTRWLSQEEWDRIQELVEKKHESCGRPDEDV